MKMKIFLCKDKDGSFAMFSSMPVRNEETGRWESLDGENPTEDIEIDTSEMEEKGSVLEFLNTFTWETEPAELIFDIPQDDTEEIE